MVSREHLALFSRESNKKTKLTSFPRDHTLNAWLYTDISDPRTTERVVEVRPEKNSGPYGI